AYSYWAHISGDDRLLEDIHETCGLWDIVFTGVELAYDGESLFGSRNMELEEGHLSSRVVDGNVAIVVEVQPLIIIKPSRTMLLSFSKVHKHIHRPHLACVWARILLFPDAVVPQFAFNEESTPSSGHIVVLPLSKRAVTLPIRHQTLRSS
ncbi:hypothetical protein PQX77_007984, partial [Marasmius sp. AFHP31]